MLKRHKKRTDKGIPHASRLPHIRPANRHSHRPDDKLSGARREQSESETEYGIEREMNEPAVGKQRAVLLHEGGKGGETAAETRGEEHAQVGVHDVSALKQCVEHTYDKTSEHIDNHCAPRETGGDTGLHCVREHVSRHSSRKAPGTYKQQYS